MLPKACYFFLRTSGHTLYCILFLAFVFFPREHIVELVVHPAAGETHFSQPLHWIQCRTGNKVFLFHVLVDFQTVGTFCFFVCLLVLTAQQGADYVSEAQSLTGNSGAAGEKLQSQPCCPVRPRGLRAPHRVPFGEYVCGHVCVQCYLYQPIKSLFLL